MKKILSLFIGIFIVLSSITIVSADNCKYKLDSDWNIITAWTEKWVAWLLWECLKWSWVVEVEGKATIEDGFKVKINKWTNNIALFLGLLSIWAVIYGWLMMTLSAGEDEKIKKAKDIVKWSLVWLLWVILATTIVTLIINIIYWFSSTGTN